MKKSITLLAIAPLITSATFAQNNRQRDDNYGNNKNRDVVLNNNRDKGGYGNDSRAYYFTAREGDIQIAAINRDYYRKVESVRNKMFMGRAKKERIIYSLDQQRDAEIRYVVARFHGRSNRFNSRDNRYGDKRARW